MSGELESLAKVGVGYDSNMQSISLIEKLDSVRLQESDSLFLLGSGELHYFFWDQTASISYSASVSHFFESETYSKLDNYLEFSYSSFVSEAAALIASIKVHNYIEDFESPMSYGDLILAMDFIFEKSDEIALFSTIKGGYFKSISDQRDIKYLNGPVLGVEGGVYFYPGANENYFKAQVGFDFSSLDDWVHFMNDGFIGVSNQYLKSSAMLEGAVFFKKSSLNTMIGYSNFVWFKIDTWRFERGANGGEIAGEKRRIEHLIKFATTFLYKITDRTALSLQGALIKNISNIDSFETAYYDYNYLRYNMGGFLKLNF